MLSEPTHTHTHTHTHYKKHIPQTHCTCTGKAKHIFLTQYGLLYCNTHTQHSKNVLEFVTQANSTLN